MPPQSGAGGGGAAEAAQAAQAAQAARHAECDTRVRVEPTRGALAPRSARALHVCVPDAGAPHHLGTHRAVLMYLRHTYIYISTDRYRNEAPPSDKPMVLSSGLLQSDYEMSTFLPTCDRVRKPTDVSFF